ncbi:MAG: TolC family protein, partial [Alphaproteobacteria bacterium]
MNRFLVSTAPVAILAALGFAALSPHAVRADDLQGAWAKAYSTNPAIAAERARVRTVDEGVPQAKAGWRPTVTLNGSTGLQYIEQESAFSNTDDVLIPTTIAGAVSQPVYRGGRTEADTQRARAEISAARASLVNVEQQVLLLVGTAYMDVLRDQAVVGLNENNVRVLKRQLQATQDRFSVGEVTRTDVAQAESRVARSEADKKTAVGNLQTTRASYTRQVGEAPTTLEAPKTLEGAPESLDASVQLAVANNPIVRQAQALHDSARHTVKLITGELYPTVALNGQLQQSFETSQ